MNIATVFIWNLVTTGTDQPLAAETLAPYAYRLSNWVLCATPGFPGRLRPVDRCKVHPMDREREFAIREVMRDVGWLPSDLNCEEKRRLAEEYLDATIEWAETRQGLWTDLVERLRRTYSALRLAEYQGPDPPVIDEARLKAARARLALEAHMAVHNC
jgi:hypothetical protein